MPKKKSQPEIEIPAKLKNRPSLWKNPDVLPKITASRKTVDESLISDLLRHDFISVKTCRHESYLGSKVQGLRISNFV
jgi:hypothetical protein